MKALVLKSTGSNYLVKADDGVKYSCKVKGTFRLKGIETTNPIAVGDYVEIEITKESDFGMIKDIYERKNYIIRKSVNLSRPSQIIATNMDLALVVATPVLPRTSTGFIDRFLATAEAYSISAGIIFNKKDMYDDEVKSYVNDLRKLYEQIGYKCFVVSSTDEKTLIELKPVLKNKVTLFSGHSGVGKSTLINQLIPNLNLKTSVISEVHSKGTHTTTFAEMHQLPDGGFIIDTPGIREFGVLEFNPAEVSHYFPELFALSKNCKFNNCSHISEKNCAVLKGLDKGVISQSRYASYLSIYHNEDFYK
ncbi:MAG: ribosome small subunit-dependent GTPase A [Bacteroidia bacterium]